MRTHVAPTPAAATWHAALFAIILLGIWLILCAILPDARQASLPERATHDAPRSHLPNPARPHRAGFVAGGGLAPIQSIPLSPPFARPVRTLRA